MGWGHYFTLGAIELSEQKAALEEMRSELARSRSESSSASFDLKDEIAKLQSENDELRLYLATIVRLLISKEVIGREEMIAIVNAVDSEDGLPDSRYRGDIL